VPTPEQYGLDVPLWPGISGFRLDVHGKPDLRSQAMGAELISFWVESFPALSTQVFLVVVSS